MSPRRPQGAGRSVLLARLDRLEARLAAIEGRLRAALAGGARPEPSARKPGARRCAGCQLELPKGARSHCPWCGFVLKVASRGRKP